MKIVPLKTPDQNLNQPRLPHLLLNGRVRADVEEDVEADEKEFILLPDKHIQDLQLFLGIDPILLIILPPHLDILTVQQIKSLNLVLQHIDNRQSHLILSQQLLKLLIVAQNVENTEDVN